MRGERREGEAREASGERERERTREVRRGRGAGVILETTIEVGLILITDSRSVPISYGLVMGWAAQTFCSFPGPLTWL